MEYAARVGPLERASEYGVPVFREAVDRVGEFAELSDFCGQLIFSFRVTYAAAFNSSNRIGET